MNELKALLFDVDGTLADTERDGHLVAFNRAFVDAGLDWHWSSELYGELLTVTGGKERMHFFINEYNTGFERPDNLDDFIKQLHIAKTKHYVNILAEGGIPLRSGVRRLIEEARAAEVRLAIVTTTSPDNVTALLTHSLAPDAVSWFEVIAAGDVVPAKKPAPDIYHYAMQEMGLDAVDCMALEDSRNGILSARGAGIKTIITVDDYTKDSDFSDAAIVLDQMGEPDAPFTVLAGNAGTSQYLDLALVKRLHAA